MGTSVRMREMNKIKPLASPKHCTHHPASEGFGPGWAWLQRPGPVPGAAQQPSTWVPVDSVVLRLPQLNPRPPGNLVSGHTQTWVCVADGRRTKAKGREEAVLPSMDTRLATASHCLSIGRKLATYSLPALHHPNRPGGRQREDCQPLLRGEDT